MNLKNLFSPRTAEIIGTTAAALALSANKGFTEEAKKPNVLFIAIDDMRPQLGCYGHEQVISPNIDRLAAEGVLFTRAYCQFPQCSASRASILSGLRPSWERYIDYPALIDKDAPNDPTLPEVFKHNGYHTISNGKILHTVTDTAERSWSEAPLTWIENCATWVDPASDPYTKQKKYLRGPFFELPDVPDSAYIDGQVCDKTIMDLRRLSKLDKPFFVACGFVRPHLPFYAPKKYWDLYDRDQIELATNRDRPLNAPESLIHVKEAEYYNMRGVEYNSEEFHKISRHGYYACISYVDALVGRLLDTLDNQGIRDNTIVILWSDHGWQLGEHNFWSKCNLMEDSINAPLIISAPGMSANEKTDALAELVDMYPTLCELAGVEAPAHLEGTSLVPVLQNPQREWKAAVFSKENIGDFVATKNFTYSEYAKDRQKERMLYDLSKDPQENVNVVNDPKYEKVAEKMRQLLHSGWTTVQPKQ